MFVITMVFTSVINVVAASMINNAATPWITLVNTFVIDKVATPWITKKLFKLLKPELTLYYGNYKKYMIL